MYIFLTLFPGDISLREVIKQLYYLRKVTNKLTVKVREPKKGLKVLESRQDFLLYYCRDFLRIYVYSVYRNNYV